MCEQVSFKFGLSKVPRSKRKRKDDRMNKVHIYACNETTTSTKTEEVAGVLRTEELPCKDLLFFAIAFLSCS